MRLSNGRKLLRVALAPLHAIHERPEYTAQWQMAERIIHTKYAFINLSGHQRQWPLNLAVLFVEGAGERHCRLVQIPEGQVIRAQPGALRWNVVRGHRTGGWGARTWPHIPAAPRQGPAQAQNAQTWQLISTGPKTCLSDEERALQRALPQPGGAAVPEALDVVDADDRLTAQLLCRGIPGGSEALGLEFGQWLSERDLQASHPAAQVWLGRFVAAELAKLRASSAASSPTIGLHARAQLTSTRLIGLRILVWPHLRQLADERGPEFVERALGSWATTLLRQLGTCPDIQAGLERRSTWRLLHEGAPDDTVVFETRRPARDSFVSETDSSAPPQLAPHSGEPPEPVSAAELSASALALTALGLAQLSSADAKALLRLCPEWRSQGSPAEQLTRALHGDEWGPHEPAATAALPNQGQA